MRKITATATDKKTYDFDKIAESRRDNASLPLNVYNWYWHPEASGDYEMHSEANPPDAEVGNIWISIRCRTVEEMKKLVDEQAGGNNV